uniref:Uncharacterized protein n=1 Tax=Kalanchoe fedtschenkoi TaxID=63787 RepID=A0A7N0T816_KALFE
MYEDGPTQSVEPVQKVGIRSHITFGDRSAEEKKQFQRAVASGELSKMIEPRDPCWVQPCFCQKFIPRHLRMRFQDHQLKKKK